MNTQDPSDMDPKRQLQSPHAMTLTPTRVGAFTLVELLVAIGIIAILVAVMIPAFGAVQTSAKRVATEARFASITQGLNSYKGEQSLGNTLPPSASDSTVGFGLYADPLDINGQGSQPYTGAMGLVYALVGADQLGTPGFRDLNDDGEWWNDFTAAPGGLYELDLANDATPVHPRFPKTGGSYVDENTRTSIRTLSRYSDDGIVDLPIDNSVALIKDQPFFTDAWNLPILYYRARKGVRRMVANPGNDLGIYDQRDNAFFTGTNATGAGAVYGDSDGIDFRTGDLNGTGVHKIAFANDPIAPIPTAGAVPLSDPTYNDTFEQFIWDSSVTAVNRPVNSDSYLLISAGADAIYGTEDDVVNWQKQKKR